MNRYLPIYYEDRQRRLAQSQKLSSLERRRRVRILDTELEPRLSSREKREHLVTVLWDSSLFTGELEGKNGVKGTGESFENVLQKLSRPALLETRETRLCKRAIVDFKEFSNSFCIVCVYSHDCFYRGWAYRKPIPSKRTELLVIIGDLRGQFYFILQLGYILDRFGAQEWRVVWNWLLMEKFCSVFKQILDQFFAV